MSQSTTTFVTALSAFAEEIKAKCALKRFDLAVTNAGDIDLLMFAAEVRGQGHGSEAMRALCAFADDHGRRILATPGHKDPAAGTTSRSRLVRFYKRFGFVENKGRNKDFTTMRGLYRTAR